MAARFSGLGETKMVPMGGHSVMDGCSLLFMRIQPEKGVKQGNSRLPAGTDSCYNTLLTYAQKQRSGKGGENMDIQEVRRLNGLQLAYIGDTPIMTRA